MGKASGNRHLARDQAWSGILGGKGSGASIRGRRGADTAKVCSVRRRICKNGIRERFVPACGPQGIEQCPSTWKTPVSLPAGGQRSVSTMLPVWRLTTTPVPPIAAFAGDVRPTRVRTRAKRTTYTTPLAVADGARRVSNTRKDPGSPVPIVCPKPTSRTVPLASQAVVLSRKEAVVPLGKHPTFFNIIVRREGWRKKL